MQSLVFLTYFFHKLWKKTFSARSPPWDKKGSLATAFSERHYFFVCFRSRGDDLRPRLPEGSEKFIVSVQERIKPALFSPVQSQSESQGRTKPESTRYTTHILHCYSSFDSTSFDSLMQILMGRGNLDIYFEYN